MADKRQKTLQSFFSRPSGSKSVPEAGFKSIQSGSKKTNAVSSNHNSSLDSNKQSNQSTSGDDAPPSKRRKVASSEVEHENYVLDFGQKDLQTQCPECGMYFNRGIEKDEKAHRIYHKEKLKVGYINWSEIVSQRIIREYSKEDATIIAIDYDSVKGPKMKRLVEIRNLVNEQLGFSDPQQQASASDQMFLFVKDKKVVGCLIAESIQTASPVVPEIQTSASSSHAENRPSVVISDVTKKAVLGVSRVWVHPSFRNQRIASRLIDSARANFCYGTLIPKSLVAMSQPSTDGAQFATKYFGGPDFLVYKSG